MKKLFFIAAIAGAALVSCTKNEVAQSVNEQQEITFASPIVGTTTKASETPVYGLLTGAYPETVSFGVWGWYSEAASYDAAAAVPYMTNVEVAYNENNHNDKETEDGAWEPSTPYYWPKNGKLTFDAYSPIELTGVSCDKATGLTIENYSVPTTLANQIDVLYSTRAYDKTNASYTNGTTYEGVDIAFNHALSAVAFTIKAADEYPEGTIKLQSITVTADSKGTFTQNIGSTPSWKVEKSGANYVIWEAAAYENSLEVEEDAKTAGQTSIVLPQEFKTSEAVITVKYYIKNGNERPLLQTAIFKLYDSVNQSGKVQKEEEEEEEAVTVDKWEMGKIYTYNITIGLQGIYFAPTIDNWDNVSVDLPQINN